MLARVPEVEQRLYSVLRESFLQSERKGIHLTDLISPRQAFFKRIDPKPLTEREIGYFVAGRGHEDVLSKLVGTHFKASEEQEIDGIHLRPDFQAITSEIIPEGEYAEFKTRRSNLPETDLEANEVFGSYRDQIRGYMALLARSRMYLVVLSLLEGKQYGNKFSESTPVFAVYLETMDEQEQGEARQRLKTIHGLLQAGLDHGPGGHIYLGLCRDWMCGTFKKQLVRDGGGWEYRVRCPWYDQCEPWKVDARRQRTA